MTDASARPPSCPRGWEGPECSRCTAWWGMLFSSGHTGDRGEQFVRTCAACGTGDQPDGHSFCRHHRLGRDLERNPRPFVWTKTADQILRSLAGYCTAINK